jgi:hypothetical protein
MESEPFPRDAMIDHLAIGYRLESVIDFDDTPTAPVKWIAVYHVPGRTAGGPGYVFSVALQRERYRGFDVFMLSFQRGAHQLGATCLVSRHVPDFIGVIEARCT